MKCLIIVLILISMAFSDITNIRKDEKAPFDGILLQKNIFADYLKIETHRDLLLLDNSSLSREITNLNLMLEIMKEQTNYMQKRVDIYYDYFEKSQKNEGKRRVLNTIENVCIIVGTVAATIGLLKLAQRTLQ